MNKNLTQTVRDMMQRVQYTPDAEKLLEFSHVPIFIYGTERYKFSDHFLLSDANAVRVGQGTTLMGSYCMRKATANGWVFPVACRETDKSRAARIFGEVYLVPPDLIITLDNLYLTVGGWQRSSEFIRYSALEDKDKKTKNMHLSACQMYLGLPDYWDADATEEFNPLMDWLVPEKDPGNPYFSFMWPDDKPNQNRKELSVE